MGFIRDKSEELTGYQEHADYCDNINFQNDFVMVYGVDANMPQRIKNFADKGYVVHLMTGIAWGEYQDYLYGKFDGREHWDEAQTTRDGKDISHGKDVPYMVPTISFADYMTERLKVAIDSGVVAIHLEEPEFWDHAGYSEAFKREYELYYKIKWIEPHLNLDSAYKSARLKSYLYSRTIDRVFAACKEYAMIKYKRRLRFYVPTHSLLNYTQWKIISPEGNLIDLPTVDGYIAQIWTGTSRTVNVYEGVLKERTFETAFLEYGIMQELVSGTDRKMWFLHDPIEDNPTYTWDNYKYNYLKTVTASLLHPKIFTYEICPWPNRVFNGKYPRIRKNHDVSEKSLPIPADYATLLCNIFNTLGDMEQDENIFEGFADGIGIFMSDTSLYQRTLPDTILKRGRQEEVLKEFNSVSLKDEYGDDTMTDEQLNAFATSITLPDFYGIALPLLKRGLPVRPVLLDNLRRYPAYLDDYKILFLTYEYMKPETPDLNNALASFVNSGGTLVYIGDSTDEYMNVQGWWNTGKRAYKDPAHHLFEMILGFDGEIKRGVYKSGKGFFAYYDKRPAKISLSKDNTGKFVNFVRAVLDEAGYKWTDANHLTLRRGYYIVSSVFEGSQEEKVFEGLFADIYAPCFDIITKKVVKPDESALLFDLNKIADKSECIIGTTNRIESAEFNAEGFILTASGADNVNANIRIKLPHEIKEIKSEREIKFSWDNKSSTVLICYKSSTEKITIEGIF